MRNIVLLFLFCVSVYSLDIEKPLYDIEHAENYFNDFVKTYNKNYLDDNERQERLKIFTDNLAKYNKMNAADTATYGVNQFSDLTKEEFKNKYTGLVPRVEESACKPITDDDITTTDAPEAFDWRQKNMVTPVKDQGSCGSCYAFSTVGNIESMYAIHSGGKLLDLSEQQLVSCTTRNNKCKGGFMTSAMEDLMDQGGIELESDYPYVDQNKLEDDKPCIFNKSLAKVKLSGCQSYDLQDEQKLKQILFKNGPISIALCADSLQHYKGGIITNCFGMILLLDHAVLLVGYGVDDKKGPYWIIKNSWSTKWGEQGYARLALGKNSCAMMNHFMATSIIA